MPQKERRPARSPVQVRSQDTRQKILAAGRELFARKGYNGTNSKEIARAAGVATGSFYAYFPDKGTVFLEITQIYYQQIFGRVQAAMARVDPATERKLLIGGLVRTLYEAHDMEPELHREISMMILAGTNQAGPDSEDRQLYLEIQRLVDELDSLVQQWLSTQLHWWGKGQLDSDPAVAAALIFRVAEETIHRLRQFPHTMPEPELVLAELTRMLDVYLDALFLDSAHLL